MTPKITASTQEHLDIYTIQDDLVILKNGGTVAVIETAAVNFDLLSEREQDAAIAAYSSLLNSLSFTAQVVIRSKRMDVTEYLKRIKTQEDSETDLKVKRKLNQYRKFIGDLITKNEVLDKNFYITVPHQTAVVPQSQGISGLANRLLWGRSTRTVKIDTAETIKNAKNQIEPKVEHLIKGLSRIGVKARQLTTQELVELFYDTYNPESAREQKIRPEAEYESPIIEAKVADFNRR